MLKIEVNKKVTSAEIVGSLAEICNDLGNVLEAIDKRLTAVSPELGHEFKCVFTKGFMEGACFDTDREHMEHYLAEMDEGERKYDEKQAQKKSAPPTLQKVVTDFLQFLKDHENPLGVKSDDTAKAEDKKDEAE